MPPTYPVFRKRMDYSISKEENKKRIPTLIMCYALFLIGSAGWWFFQIGIDYKSLLIDKNLFFSLTKLGVLVSGIGMLKMKKWSVYLYIVIYFITAVSFFYNYSEHTFSAKPSLVVAACTFSIITILLSTMFVKYWNEFK